MKKQDTSRRAFFKKIGLGIGAAALIETEAYADINMNKYSTPEERDDFISRYENWVEQYIDVVEEEKRNQNNIENKKRIMELSAEADGWQNQIKEYIKHDDFKERYIEVSKKFASVITVDLES
ncbi:hypothetical protein [Marinifilum caeruleilacunae]|uniref:Twin-arginine translocation signal domain-containing protein n=1 Tax=Marinifilum caeruleilacunae TaxID=2499076 RepID=A0ABX1WSM1_9BACT|nr:hypothetical protein [Marinifilum caeruleilacunae]NOU58987.1 hypothetical protein [Marinifilum caeruleilacunae]